MKQMVPIWQQRGVWTAAADWYFAILLAYIDYQTTASSYLLFVRTDVH